MTDKPNSGGDYDIGYRKPPAQHRFKKGQSGNPLGRPRKLPGASNSPDRSQISSWILEEGSRLVPVREGGQTTMMPAAQAVLRARGIAAMKGNRLAQREFLEEIRRVEDEENRVRLEHFNASAAYKSSWEERIELARKQGLPEPQPIPHPDDIVLDFINGEAFVCGPMTKQQKREWDAVLTRRDRLQERVSVAAGAYRGATTPKSKALALENWKSTQQLFDQLNDDLPTRYRAGLSNRCLHDGASLPGQNRKTRWPGED